MTQGLLFKSPGLHLNSYSSQTGSDLLFLSLVPLKMTSYLSLVILKQIKVTHLEELSKPVFKLFTSQKRHKY